MKTENAKLHSDLKARDKLHNEAEQKAMINNDALKKQLEILKKAADDTTDGATLARLSQELADLKQDMQEQTEENERLKQQHEKDVEIMKTDHVNEHGKTKEGLEKEKYEHVMTKEAHQKEIDKLTRYQNAILAKNEERKEILLKGTRQAQVENVTLTLTLNP